MSESKKMRLEAIVASPPTSKCKEILAMMEAAVSAQPELLTLNIYFAGEAPDVTPSKGYQSKGKFKRVPSIFVNGALIGETIVPSRDALDIAIHAAIEKGPQSWVE